MLGMNFIVSDKLLNIIERFSLSSYNKIPINILGFFSKYYLVGFPMVSNINIVLSKSVFFDIENKREVTFNSYESYDEININIQPKNIFLSGFFDVDIVNVQGEGIFFSEPLINALTEGNVAGLDVSNIVLTT